ncbi:MAG: peptide deformylase [Chthoniobacterales bacterium]|nr:peptide deformylase [Chthoniobacterales bacterium]
MILEIVKYGHPALRARGARIKKVDQRIRELAANMIETMIAADGCGLAAQQIGIPLRLCVVDIREVQNRPSRMWINSNEVDPNKFMPLVLINPEVETLGSEEAGTEGCLSLPGITAEILRPARVKVTATNLEEETIQFEAAGLLSRAIQHEFDHLNGVLFIDRMDLKTREAVQPLLDKITPNKSHFLH